MLMGYLLIRCARRPPRMRYHAARMSAALVAAYHLAYAMVITLPCRLSSFIDHTLSAIRCCREAPLIDAALPPQG